MTRKSGHPHKGWKSATATVHLRSRRSGIDLRQVVKELSENGQVLSAPGAYLADGTKIEPRQLHPFYGDDEI